MSDEPHEASVAVWDIPTPVVRDRPCSVKIGVACSSRCSLAGHEVSVHDADGALLGAARLSTAPWPGTSALYWGEVELPALRTEGPRTLHVRCNHDGDASSTFSVTVAGRPEHSVRIVAVDATTGGPIDGVEVRVDVFRSTTGDDGTTTIAVPRGTYDVILWKVGYQASPVTIAVSEDVSVAIDMQVVRKAEQPYWM